MLPGESVGNMNYSCCRERDSIYIVKVIGQMNSIYRKFGNFKTNTFEIQNSTLYWKINEIVNMMMTSVICSGNTVTWL